MGNLSFGLRPVILQGANLSATGSTDSDVFIEYKNYYPYDTHVATYRVTAKLSLSNVVVNDDLSIEFDYGGIQYVRAYSTWAKGAVGYSVRDTLFKGDDSQAWTYTHDIGEAMDSFQVPVATQPIQHYKVPPNGSIKIPETKAFTWVESAIVSDECEVYVGGTVTNIIPTYKPNGLRKGGEWKGVQALTLSTYIRKGGSWSDVGTEQVSTIGQVNEGNTRRRQREQWKQEGPFS